MRQNASCTEKHRFPAREKRRLGPRVRQAVVTNPFLSQNDVKRNLSQKCRFGTRFRKTVITNKV